MKRRISFFLALVLLLTGFPFNNLVLAEGNGESGGQSNPGALRNGVVVGSSCPKVVFNDDFEHWSGGVPVQPDGKPSGWKIRGTESWPAGSIVPFRQTDGKKGYWTGEKKVNGVKVDVWIPVQSGKYALQMPAYRNGVLPRGTKFIIEKEIDVSQIAKVNCKKTYDFSMYYISSSNVGIENPGMTDRIYVEFEWKDKSGNRISINRSGYNNGQGTKVTTWQKFALKGDLPKNAAKAVIRAVPIVDYAWGIDAAIDNVKFEVKAICPKVIFKGGGDTNGTKDLVYCVPTGDPLKNAPIPKLTNINQKKIMEWRKITTNTPYNDTEKMGGSDIVFVPILAQNFEVTKKWPDTTVVPEDQRPKVTFELQRKLKTQGNDAFRSLTDKDGFGPKKPDSAGKVTWKDVPLNVLVKNKNTYVDTQYDYRVKEVVGSEVKVPTDHNWISQEGSFTEAGGKQTVTVTNTLLTDEDPDDPSDDGDMTKKHGKLTIKKVLKNEPKRTRRSIPEPIRFGFQVTGPYGYEKEFTLKAGEDLALNNLFYGEYTVKETEKHGYTSNYEVKKGTGNVNGTTDVTVTLEPGDGKKEGEVVVTNSHKVSVPKQPITQYVGDDPFTPEHPEKLYEKIDLGGGTATSVTIPGDYTTDKPGGPYEATVTVKKDGDTYEIKVPITVVPLDKPFKDGEIERTTDGPAVTDEEVKREGGIPEDFGGKVELDYPDNYDPKKPGDYPVTVKITVPGESTPITHTVTIKITEPESENGLTVKIEKIWDGGFKPGDDHGAVEIALMRKGYVKEGDTVKEGVPEKVKDPLVLKYGENGSRIYTGLAKHDGTGRPYTYYVVEPELKYYDVKKEEKGKTDGAKAWTVTLTNTYVAPKATFTGTVEWPGTEEIPENKRPEVKLTLMVIDKKTGNLVPAKELIPGIETKVPDKNGKVTWPDVPITDHDAEPYEFFLKEEIGSEPKKPTDDNWVIPKDEKFEAIPPTQEGEDPENFTAKITNKLIDRPHDGKEPGEGEQDLRKKGVLYVSKELKSVPTPVTTYRSAKEPLKFKVKIIDPYGKVKYDDVITAGGLITLKDLYYGEYTVEETESKNYTPIYKGETENVVADKNKATVTLKIDDVEGKVKIVNTHKVEVTGDPLTKKVGETPTKEELIGKITGIPEGWKPGKVTIPDNFDNTKKGGPFEATVELIDPEDPDHPVIVKVPIYIEGETPLHDNAKTQKKGDPKLTDKELIELAGGDPKDPAITVDVPKEYDPNVPGEYKVTVKKTPEGGGDPFTSTVTVIVVDEPTPAVEGDPIYKKVGEEPPTKEDITKKLVGVPEGYTPKKVEIPKYDNTKPGGPYNATVELTDPKDPDKPVVVEVPIYVVDKDSPLHDNEKTQQKGDPKLTDKELIELAGGDPKDPAITVDVPKEYDPNVPGEYKVTVTKTPEEGGDPVKATVTVTVLDKPDPKVYADPLYKKVGETPTKDEIVGKLTGIPKGYEKKDVKIPKNYDSSKPGGPFTATVTLVDPKDPDHPIVVDVPIYVAGDQPLHDNSVTQKQGTPPMTEKELIELAGGDPEDPTFTADIPDSYDPNKPGKYEVTVKKTPDGGGTPITAKVTITVVPKSATLRNITIEKIWDGGQKPSVTIELWQKGHRVVTPATPENGLKEPVTEEFSAKVGELVTTKGKKFNNKITLENLRLHDDTGREFEYYVVEKNKEDLKETYHYTSEEPVYNKDTDSFTVKNTFVSPRATLTGETTWPKDVPEKERPYVTLKLQKKIAGSEDPAADVPGTEVVPKDNKGTWDMPLYDHETGLPYEYQLVETIGEPNHPDPKDDNWVIPGPSVFKDKGTGKEFGATIENKLIDQPHDGDEPHDGQQDMRKKGEISLKKILQAKPVYRFRSAALPPAIEFTFTITGPYGYEKVVKLSPDKEETLLDLYYGDYTIEESDSQGYHPLYEGTENVDTDTYGKAIVTLTKDKNPSADVVATNQQQINIISDEIIQKVGDPLVTDKDVLKKVDIPTWADKSKIKVEIPDYTTDKPGDHTAKVIIPDPNDPEKPIEVDVPIHVIGGEEPLHDGAITHPKRDNKDDGVTDEDLKKKVGLPEDYDGEVTIHRGSYDPTTPGTYKVTVTIPDSHEPGRTLTSTVTITVLESDGENIRNILLGKVWKRGGKKPSVTLELWAAGYRNVPGEPAAEGENNVERYKEKVGSFTTTEGKDSYQTFYNLPVHDNTGREIEYSVVEKDIPKNYTSKVLYDKAKDAFIVENTRKGSGWIWGPGGFLEGGASKDEPIPETEKKEETKKIERHCRYVVGFPDGEFKPQNNITRAQVATIYARILRGLCGELKFATVDTVYPDVTRNHWASGAIQYLTAKGIMKGYEDGTFKPEQSITRAEYAAIISRMKNLASEKGATLTDVAGHWAVKEINGVYHAGIIKGYEDGTFRPNRPITRAEAVTMTNRMLGRRADDTFLRVKKNEYYNFPDVPENHWAYREVYEAALTHDFVRDGVGETWVRIVEGRTLADVVR